MVDRITFDPKALTFEALLGYMQGRLKDPKFSRYVGDFTGRYQFRSRDGGMALLVRFENGNLEKSEEINRDVDVTVEFKDGGALMKFLLRPARAILEDLLDLVDHKDLLVRKAYKGLLAQPAGRDLKDPPVRQDGLDHKVQLETRDQ